MDAVHLTRPPNKSLSSKEEIIKAVLLLLWDQQFELIKNISTAVMNLSDSRLKESQIKIAEYNQMASDEQYLREDLKKHLGTFKYQ